jgi:hypothetical protein
MKIKKECSDMDTKKLGKQSRKKVSQIEEELQIANGSSNLKET